MFRPIPRVRVGAIACAATLAGLVSLLAPVSASAAQMPTPPVSASAAPGGTAPANAAVPVASIQIENVYTHTCLDASEFTVYGVGSQATVKLESCGIGSFIQQWEIVPHSGYYNIVLTGFPYCLDGVEGTNHVTLQQCIAGDRHQQWSAIRVNGAVINSYQDQANGECLDGTIVYGVRVMPCSPANIPDTHQWWGQA